MIKFRPVGKAISVKDIVIPFEQFELILFFPLVHEELDDITVLNTSFLDHIPEFSAEDKDTLVLENPIQKSSKHVFLALVFEVLEDIEMVEVKQGPYAGDKCKTRFVSKIPSIQQL